MRSSQAKEKLYYYVIQESGLENVAYINSKLSVTMNFLNKADTTIQMDVNMARPYMYKGARYWV